MPPRIDEAAERWEAYLTRLRERAGSLIAEEAPPLPEVPSLPAPWEPLPGAEALRDQLLELVAKADEAWFLQVRAAFERPGADTRVTLEAESRKIEGLRAWLRVCLEDSQVRRLADLARAHWEAQAPRLPDQLRCVGCGSGLPLPLPYLPQDLACPDCALINAYRPPALLTDFVIPALAREEAWETLQGLPRLPKPAALKTSHLYGTEMGQWTKRYQQG
nr:hypothetical protein [uncultured Holophaga sp.]